MKPLSQYVPICEALAREAFEQRHPGPFLVHSSRVGGALLKSGGGMTIDSVVLDDAGDAGGDSGAEVQSVFTVSQFVPQRADLAIGSDPNAALRIPAASVSRTHARLRSTGGRWRIEDAGSSFGTWINGESLEPGASRDLQPGDRVSLGALDLTFFSAGAFYDLVKNARR